MGKFIMNTIGKWKDSRLKEKNRKEDSKLKDKIKKMTFMPVTSRVKLPFTIYFTDEEKEIERRKSGPFKRGPHFPSLMGFHTPVQNEDELINMINDGTLFYGGCMVQSGENPELTHDLEEIINKYFSKNFPYKIESFLIFMSSYVNNNNIEVANASKRMTYYIHFGITENMWSDFVDYFFKYK